MSLLAVGGEGPTPRTPEILNSLMSMTNPFDAMKTTHLDMDGQALVPPVQHTRSQLIKEGLKLTLQTKRKQHIPKSPPPPDYSPLTPNSDQLTPEDEERRKRRRERNKIAATKCRLKKREKTFNLVHESEILETQNMDLKSQIQDLENEKRRLVDMLSHHRSNCAKSNYSGYQESYQHHQNNYHTTKEYSKIEISCETTISYQREDGYSTSRQRYDNYPQPYQLYPESPAPYPRSVTPSHYPRTSSISTSSSDFDSVKDVDSPAISQNHYHNYEEESDNYLPIYPESTVTHS